MNNTQNVSNPLADLDIDFGNLTKKIIKQAPITKEELKGIVDTYYDIQDIRIICGNRRSALERTKGNGAAYLMYVESTFKDTENTLKKIMQEYCEKDPIGRWLLSIPGIGPTLASGLLTHINIEKCQTAGSLWSYAGWTGERTTLKKGEKITFNPNFRKLCWLIGQQFIKVQNRDNDIYGKLYKEKKELYMEKNENGGFADKAAEELKLKKYKPTTEAYKAYTEGKLPVAHINAMANRFAVKIFLSHLFTLWYEYHNGKPAPRPFAEIHLGHVHIIEPPHREIIFGDK